MKLKGAAKKAFLARMAKGRKNAAKKSKSVKKTGPKRTKSVKRKTKSVKVKKTNTKRKPMARRKSRVSRARSKVGGFLNNPTLKKVMLGVGASTVAGAVVGTVAPQFAPITKPITALAVGGPIGAIASIFLDGGLSQLGGLFGGTQTQSSGGLSV